MQLIRSPHCAACFHQESEHCDKCRQSCNCVQGMLLHVLAVLSGSTAVVMVYTLLLIIQPHPWWSAQYMIAILGLLLGSALSCVAAGLSSAIDELSRGDQSAGFSPSQDAASVELLRKQGFAAS